MWQIWPMMTQTTWLWPRMTYQGSRGHQGVQGAGGRQGAPEGAIWMHHKSNIMWKHQMLEIWVSVTIWFPDFCFPGQFMQENGEKWSYFRIFHTSWSVQRVWKIAKSDISSTFLVGWVFQRICLFEMNVNTPKPNVFADFWFDVWIFKKNLKFLNFAKIVWTTVIVTVKKFNWTFRRKWNGTVPTFWANFPI